MTMTSIFTADGLSGLKPRTTAQARKAILAADRKRRSLAKSAATKPWEALGATQPHITALPARDAATAQEVGARDCQLCAKGIDHKVIGGAGAIWQLPTPWPLRYAEVAARGETLPSIAQIAEAL